jgi:hypothetical protein
MPHFETTSARELAEAQEARIAELEAALKASHAVLRELLARLADLAEYERLDHQSAVDVPGTALKAVAKALASVGTGRG